MRRPSGFTLIEILAAMSIFAFGMLSVFTLVYGSMKIGISAADRNAAAVIIPQAIDDIQRTYQVTGNMQFAGLSATPSTEQIDTLLLTVASNPNDPSCASIQQPAFGVFKGASVTPPVTDPTSTAVWPIGLNPVYYGGPGGIASGTGNDMTSFAYRVIFKLERHPQWVTGDTDAFAGMYVLTLVVYRDLNRKATRLEQVSDPVVVYLRDKKVRL